MRLWWTTGSCSPSWNAPWIPTWNLCCPTVHGTTVGVRAVLSGHIGADVQATALWVVIMPWPRIIRSTWKLFAAIYNYWKNRRTTVCFMPDAIIGPLAFRLVFIIPSDMPRRWRLFLSFHPSRRNNTRHCRAIMLMGWSTSGIFVRGWLQKVRGVLHVLVSMRNIR